MCSYHDLVRQKITKTKPLRILLYAQLTPATGNATSAKRYKQIFEERGEVLLRGLNTFSPDDEKAVEREVRAI